MGIASRETDHPFPSNPAIFTPIDVNRDKVPVAPPPIHRAIPPAPPTTEFNFTFKLYWTQLGHLGLSGIARGCGLIQYNDTASISKFMGLSLKKCMGLLDYY